MDNYVKTQDYIREIITIFFIQKKIIFSIVLISILISLAIAFFWPPTYVSTGAIFLKSKKILKSPEEIEKVQWKVTPVSETDLYSEMGIFTSDELIKRALKKIDYKKILHVNLNDPIVLQETIKKVKKNLETVLKPKSTIFEVSLKWDNPETAKILLDALTKEYVLIRSEIQSPKEAIPFFETQLKKFNDELIKHEEQLIKISQNNNAPDPSVQISSNLLTIKNIDLKINDLVGKISLKKKELDYIQKLLKNNEMNYYTFIKSDPIADLSKKIQDLVLEREKLRKFYTDENPKIKSMTEEINKIYLILKNEVQKYLTSEKAKLNGMQNSLKDLEKRANELMFKNVKLYEAKIHSKQIQRELSILENAYKIYSERLQEAKIKGTTAAGQIFTVNILSTPSLNLSPVFPVKKKVLSMGVILGFLLGITIGFLVEFFDHTFKRPEDVTNNTGLKTIFSIPDWEK